MVSGSMTQTDDHQESLQVLVDETRHIREADHEMHEICHFVSRIVNKVVGRFS